MCVKALLINMQKCYLDQVLAIEQASFAMPWPASAFLAEQELPCSYFKVVGLPEANQQGLQVLGYIVCRILSSDMHVLNLAVAQVFRRQGLARFMISNALRQFALLGGGTVTLEVRPSNQGAQRLYTSFGFRKDRVYKGYYIDNKEDAIVMTLFVKGKVRDKIYR